MSERGSLLRKQHWIGGDDHTAITTREQHPAVHGSDAPYRAFASVALDHGCGSVSQLLGREGYDVVKEVWGLQVSSSPLLDRDRHLSFTF